MWHLFKKRFQKAFDCEPGRAIVPKNLSCALVEDIATLLTQFSAPLPFGEELTCELERVNQTMGLRDLHGKRYPFPDSRRRLLANHSSPLLFRTALPRHQPRLLDTLLQAFSRTCPGPLFKNTHMPMLGSTYLYACDVTRCEALLNHLLTM